MDASLIDIGAKGRFDLFHKSCLDEMFVDAQSGGNSPRRVSESRRTIEPNARETEEGVELNVVGGGYLIELFDVDLAGNCVTLGFIESTTLTPEIEPDDEPTSPDGDEQTDTPTAPSPDHEHEHGHGHGHGHGHEHEHGHKGVASQEDDGE